jgi:hypothetical protein
MRKFAWHQINIRSIIVMIVALTGGGHQLTRVGSEEHIYGPPNATRMCTANPCGGCETTCRAEFGNRTRDPTGVLTEQGRGHACCRLKRSGQSYGRSRN